MSDKLIKIDDYGLDLVQLIKEIGIVVDYSQIAKYEQQRKDLVNLDLTSAPMYLRDFTDACYHVSNVLAKLRLALSAANYEMDAQESKAKLERAPVYFEENDTLGGAIKDSSALRDTYVRMDALFRRAKQRVEALTALYKFLNDKYSSFEKDYYSAKKIYDNLGGGPGAKTGYHGMSSGGKIGDSSNG